MILCDCPRCGRRELRGDRSIHAVPTPRGDVLAVRCRRCGAVVSVGRGRLLSANPVDAVA